MKKYGKIISLFIIIVIICIVALIANIKQYNKNNEKTKIVTSFYPIYIITLNITDGIENVEVQNMTDVNIGCLHNYTLTTTDLIKLEEADIFIQNGLGIENFIEKIKNTYSNIKVIDSSKKVENIITQEKEINGHIWLNLDNYIKQIEEITDRLCQIDEKNKEKYIENSKEYISKIQNIEEEYKMKLQNLNSKKMISLNEAFRLFREFFKYKSYKYSYRS